MPQSLVMAVGAGIGLFIAFIGLCEYLTFFGLLSCTLRHTIRTVGPWMSGLRAAGRLTAGIMFRAAWFLTCFGMHHSSRAVKQSFLHYMTTAALT